MFAISVFSFSTAFFCFLLALVILNNSIHKPLNRIFGLFCLSSSFWSFAEFMARQSETMEQASFWFNFEAIWPLSITLFFHFTLEFTNYLKKNKWRIIIYSTYLIATVFTFYEYLFNQETVVWRSWGWTYLPLFGISELVIALWGALLCIAAVSILTNFYFSTKVKSLKVQTLLIITGAIIPATAGLCSEVFFPLFIAKVPELTNVSLSFMVLPISYAILRHNLFHLRPIEAAEQIFQTMSDALIVINIKNEIIMVNKALLNMLCYREDEIIGNDPKKLIKCLISTPTNDLINTGTINDLQTEFIRKDGSTIPISLSWSVLYKAKDKISGIVFLGRDISERQQALEALKQARDELEQRVEQRTLELEERNKMLQQQIEERAIAERDLAEQKEYLSVTLRSIGDGVITVDENDIIVFLNKAAEAITGWNQQDAAGKMLSKVFQVRCSEQNSRNLCYHQEITNHRVEIQSLSGITHVLSESRSAIFDITGKTIGYVIVFRDITEKEILEEELFKSRKLESLSLLASGLAHDFNNLITGIITNLFMAKIGVPANTDSYDMITNAEKAAFRASSLTKQLLSFARDKGTPNREISSIKELIEESVGFYLSGSRCDYRLDIEDNLYMADVDRGQIDQVLNNIIVNADQSMPHGGIISVKAYNVEITKNTSLPLQPGKYICISIADEGVGIPPENIQRIFDPYFTTRQYGNGLGLSSAYSIIQKHKGHITVQSELNAGTIFKIYLPASDSAYLQQEITEKDSREAKGKILLLDDDDIVRRSTERLLSHMGYKVFMASDGEQAVRLYKTAIDNENPFDVAILDLTIPGGKGAQEIIEELFRLNPATKAVVSSGYPNDPAMAEYESFGFCAAISKPYNIEELDGLLKKIILVPEA